MGSISESFCAAKSPKGKRVAFGFRVIGIAALIALTTQAQAFEPVRDVYLLDHPIAEEVIRVAGAKVVLADYVLLKKDFPELQGLGDDAIDAWLLKHVAYISEPQAAQSLANTTIAVTTETTKAYRPKDYGRALVYRAGESGLIDAKGTGAVKPRVGGHIDGLSTLGESIREFLYEKLVHRILESSGSGVETVGTYAVVDWGFDVKHEDGKTSPAGLTLRQAHQRYPGSGSMFSAEKSVAVEKVLRKYGVTSAGAFRSPSADRLNVQGTLGEKAIIDFGGFLSVEKFERPATLLASDTLLMDPKAPDFIQPDPRLRVPFDLWGYSVKLKDDPKADNPWVWSHELATHLRSGTATRADVQQHLRNLLEPVQGRIWLCPEFFAGAGK